MKWADDKDTDHCQLCKQAFSISRRKVSQYSAFTVRQNSIYTYYLNAQNRFMFAEYIHFLFLEYIYMVQCFSNFV